MKQMICLVATVFLLWSCEAKKATGPTGTVKPVSEKVEAGGVEESSEEGAAQIREAVDTQAESAEAVAASAKEGAEEKAAELPDLSTVTESTFSIEQLKRIAGSLKTDQLLGIANRLLDGINNNQSIIDTLKDEIGKLGIADLGKAGELKQKSESAATNLGGLTEKLQVVVDQLKKSGVDVSKFTSVLGGS